MENRSKFGLMSIVLLGLNNVIGSGIFLLPGQAYTYMGKDSLWVYVIDALLALSLALCFAEAAGMFDKSGGTYIYAKEAFGEFVGFEVGIMKWATCIISSAAMAVGFITALGVFWPAANDPFNRNLLSIALLILLAIMNIVGVEVAKYFNNIITIGKLIPFIVFLSAGVFFIKGANFESGSVPVDWSTGMVPALLLVFFAFTGFESIAVAAEDMENPKKNIPIAILITITVASIVYILTQAVSVGTLGGLLATPGICTTPVAESAGSFMGSFGKILISIGTLVSIGGVNVANSFVTPRCGVALSEYGILPKFISKNSRYKTPYIAIIISTLLGIPLILTGSFTQLAMIAVISRFAEYIPTSLSILILRKKEGLNKDGFRLPFGPVIPVVAVIACIGILINNTLQKGGLESLLWGLGGMVIAAPIYFAMNYLNNSNKEKIIEQSSREMSKVS